MTLLAGLTRCLKRDFPDGEEILILMTLTTRRLKTKLSPPAMLDRAYPAVEIIAVSCLLSRHLDNSSVTTPLYST